MLVVSYIGYEKVITEINSNSYNVTMKQKAFMANEVVVSASRVKESYLSAPVSVEKLDLLDIKRSPSASFYDALDNLKEVEMKTGSILYKSMNARGFGGTTNSGFIQLVDGANNAPIASGQFAFGNMLGIPEIDIASVELLPGAASALYGPNAYSGIMFINSKTPFFYQGLSAVVKTGVTSEEVAGTNPYSDISFRYAKAYDKFAFKTSFSNISAHDWHAYDDSYVVDSDGNPHPHNKVNLYGDEYGQSVDLDGLFYLVNGAFPDGWPFNGEAGPTDQLPTIPIYRTGYTEDELYNYKADNTKYSGSLQYKITDDLMASYIYRYAEGQTLFQSLNKYILKGINGQYHQAELKSSQFTLRFVNFAEDAGEAYDMLFTSFNINRAAKSDNAWFADYGAAYWGQFTPVGGLFADYELTTLLNPSIADDARYFADYGGYLNDGVIGQLLFSLGEIDNPLMTVDSNPDFLISLSDPMGASGTKQRFEAGSDEFNEALQNSIDTPYSIGGSGFTSTSQYNDIEAMYDFGNQFSMGNLLVGGNYKMYRPETGGTIYSDTPDIVAEHGNIEVNEWGIYAQISKQLLSDRLKLQASYRADGHTNFETHLSPRFSAVYSINDFQHVRMSYQEGFTNPTIQTQYLAVNLGVQHSIGGAKK
jgi:outer membrane receptor protein involved in Fe transport